MKRKWTILIIPIITIISVRCTNNNPVEPKWENNIYRRIQPAPVGGGLTMKDYWVWGSSVIKGEDGLYHMYASRWPKKLLFHPGWMTNSEIIHAVSSSPEGPYEFRDVAIGARGAEYWDGRMAHNPRILKYKDTYVLFYIGSTHPFDGVLENPDTLKLMTPFSIVARSNKRIGIATSKNPNGPWVRRDQPILETKPNSFYSFLTSNPAPWINEDGSVVMLFKSRAYNKTQEFPFQTNMMIGVATAPDFEGPYTVSGDEPIFGIDKMGVVEDPYLWKDKSGYHIIAKDMRAAIVKEYHAGILAHSKDAIHWTVDESPLAYSRNIKWDDGHKQVMGQLERASGLIEDGILTHLFFATMDGPGGFENSTKSWNMVVPLSSEFKNK